MPSPEPDEVVERTDFPRQDVGAPLPLVLADDAHLALAYFVEGDEDEDAAAIVFFPRYESFSFGGPNDEALEGHPSYDRRLQPYGVFEVRRSSWLDRLERVNSVHEHHDPAWYAALHHLVFTFHDTLFECAVPRWDVRSTRGTHASLLDEMHALMRHGSATVLPLFDDDRGRSLPTTLYLPWTADSAPAPAPLVVFAHGLFGHPRKFTRLLRAWADAGFAVAAPAFPLTNDEASTQLDRDDVVNQPRDVSFVIDTLVRARNLFALDAERIGVAGFSLGGHTALAVGFNVEHRDARVRAVIALAGRFWDAGGRFDMSDTPLLVVHGTLDHYAEGLEVFESAGGPKRLLALEGAGHDIAQDTSPHLDEVIPATTEFWDAYLRG